MDTYRFKWVRIEYLSGPIWYMKICWEFRNIKFFVVREKKGQAAFSPLVLLSGTEGVLQNWNGKTSRADRRSASARGGSKRKGCETSAGAWESRIPTNLFQIYI